MHSQRVAHEKHSEEVDEMNADERLAKLEVKVDHLQSDVTEVKTDTRQLREAVHSLQLGLEKFKWRLWAALAVLFVMQVLTMGGAPAAIARAFRLP